MIIVTGLSGSGKSTAIDALEDAGYFCVDNMPASLVPDFLLLRSRSGSGVQKIALGMDLRQEGFVEEFKGLFEILKERGFAPDVLFLEASDDALLKRYSETRRQHPVSREGGPAEGIREERKKLGGLKTLAGRVIDTSRLTVHELKELIIRHAAHGERPARMRIGLVSFGFKHGAPQESDLVMDVRFIPNPYFIPELKPLDGRDERVRRFILEQPGTLAFLDRYVSLLEYLLPLYEREGKSYLTIAVGCTGGRHRSVTVVEELLSRLGSGRHQITAAHRDVDAPW